MTQESFLTKTFNQATGREMYKKVRSMGDGKLLSTIAGIAQALLPLYSRYIETSTYKDSLGTVVKNAIGRVSYDIGATLGLPILAGAVLEHAGHPIEGLGLVAIAKFAGNFVAHAVTNRKRGI